MTSLWNTLQAIKLDNIQICEVVKYVISISIEQLQQNAAYL